ncbi:MAG TPA: hypothetical protein VFB62_21950 [Polyangiaceae bacterium]|nr:hypothetical protein [Polyangiaceae bacterium]
MLSRSIACVGAAFVLSCTFPDVTIVETGSSSSSSSGGSTASVGSGGAGGEVPCTIDEDEDGSPSSVCGGPDCNDEDARAKPSQPSYFDSPMLGRAAPGGAFDFDCSGAEEKDPTDLLTGCTLMNVCSGEGWDEATAVCGTVNGWMKCKTVACEPQPEPTTQLLRCH